MTIRCPKCKRRFRYPINRSDAEHGKRLQAIKCPHCEHQVGEWSAWKTAAGWVQEASFGKLVSIRVLYTDEKVPA